jgi:hypothetical protein
MPDIAMCKDNLCPIRERCFRFRAKPSEPFQWYDRNLRYGEKTGCNKYWEIPQEKMSNYTDFPQEKVEKVDPPF